MSRLKYFFKCFELFAKWCKYQEFVLIEFTLFQHFKEDALYIFFIQIFKFVFSLSFNIYNWVEWLRAEEGIPF
jgi:hypothetical protein